MPEIADHTHLGLITSILLLLVCARILGELMNSMKQPAVVGEILAGILLGPAVFDIVQPSRELAGISELSIFLILLGAGLEMDFQSVMRAFLGRTVFIGTFSFFLPLVAGITLGHVFEVPTMGSIILGLCLAITALPVIARILGNFGILQESLGQNAIATAILNDIVALFCLGVILGLGTSVDVSFTSLLGSISKTGVSLIGLAVLILGTYYAFVYFGEKTRAIQTLLGKAISIFGKESLFGLAVLFVLAFGAVSERLSSHFVIGVFFGGLLISPAVIGPSAFKYLEQTLKSISTGFLAPIFFCYIGLNFSWSPILTPMGALFAMSVIALSIGSKILGARIASSLARIPAKEAVGIGIVLNSRGTMDLVVADIALNSGYINSELFSVLVLLGVVATFITPFLFSFVIKPTSSQTDPVSLEHE